MAPPAQTTSASGTAGAAAAPEPAEPDRPNVLVRLADQIIAVPVDFIEEVGNLFILFGQTVSWLIRRPYRFRLFFQAMDFVGVGSVAIVCLVGLFSGMVFALQSVEAFRTFQAESFVGSTVAIALCRELAPVFTGIMITARAGSAIATELGTMRITEQIDALATCAVNPVQYLVVPRVIAGLLMTPVMCMVFIGIGLVGAYGIAVWYKGVDPGIFIANIRWYADPRDIFQGLIKATVFGVLLTLIGCYQGFYASGGARGVGIATTKAVVHAAVTVLVIDYFLTEIILAVAY
jgi:phospholipid/cholesterol/gamma-HCH transport system permease protein